MSTTSHGGPIADSSAPRPDQAYTNGQRPCPKTLPLAMRADLDTWGNS